ncbi:uncharacterized protein MYCFIDRAFT_177900 [Pseudocercospora fijiensis CIRAD86]|uniref:FAD-binding PCMH-type domain-containing protein n=1 Tax=Pseudocercospora fijiensis (strain CIRAD86) TaxID=383855 RepID=M3APD1_PSEFD|nr:uncharacterized protein MYCFIDRAFT_177900 [Pseudocercospora fijiensis CIRAD86]EME79272.1 hypothetical protein MYCFIDRAFT_177900 [Pseudocercospora fijiensis CIRAD86]
MEGIDVAKCKIDQVLFVRPDDSRKYACASLSLSLHCLSVDQVTEARFLLRTALLTAASHNCNMATLGQLRSALRDAASSSSKDTLTDLQYSDGFELSLEDPGLSNYHTFVIPRLSKLVSEVTKTKQSISILEIGSGPKTVLGELPIALRWKVNKYAAFEPNNIFAGKLESYLRPQEEKDTPFPHMTSEPVIMRIPFSAIHEDEKFDIILFCHSMYGMNPRRPFIEKAMDLLPKPSYPTGHFRISDEDEEIDKFAAFIAGFTVQDYALQQQWRIICRDPSHRLDTDSAQLALNSPEIMVAFNASARAVPELLLKVPSLSESRALENPESRQAHPAVILRPTDPGHVQDCVHWAVEHDLSLTAIGGSHSGHCVADNVVAMDMSAFCELQIPPANKNAFHAAESLIVAGAGCNAGEIIRTTMEAGLTVPLGSRPSVGAGLWLQGGIGHLSRRYGLACDAIADSMRWGYTHKDMKLPANAIRREDKKELLWAIRGAGTNIGVLLYVVFKGFRALSFLSQNWKLSLSDKPELQSRIIQLSNMTKGLSRNASIDMYIFYDSDQVKLGVSSYEVFCKKHSAGVTIQDTTPLTSKLRETLGHEDSSIITDAVGLFETEIYISGMHGGHGGGKTSSFKRCVFMRNIESTKVVDSLSAAMATRPTPICYTLIAMLRLLQEAEVPASKISVIVVAEFPVHGARKWLQERGFGGLSGGYFQCLHVCNWLVT